MHTMHKSGATLLGAILLMSGCGGGGGSDGPPPIAFVNGTDVPVSATQSADAAVAFVAQLQAADSDSSDPRELGDAVLATDDSAEPSDV